MDQIDTDAPQEKCTQSAKPPTQIRQDPIAKATLLAGVISFVGLIIGALITSDAISLVARELNEDERSEHIVLIGSTTAANYLAKEAQSALAPDSVSLKMIPTGSFIGAEILAEDQFPKGASTNLSLIGMSAMQLDKTHFRAEARAKRKYFEICLARQPVYLMFGAKTEVKLKEAFPPKHLNLLAMPVGEAVEYLWRKPKWESASSKTASPYTVFVTGERSATRAIFEQAFRAVNPEGSWPTDATDWNLLNQQPLGNDNAWISVGEPLGDGRAEQMVDLGRGKLFKVLVGDEELRNNICLYGRLTPSPANETRLEIDSASTTFLRSLQSALSRRAPDRNHINEQFGAMNLNDASKKGWLDEPSYTQDGVIYGYLRRP